MMLENPAALKILCETESTSQTLPQPEAPSHPTMNAALIVGVQLDF